MPKFSDGTMEQVRAIGIERVVEQYVELRGRPGSRELWGLCPFHNENSPSFKIDIEKGFFKCFGCDAKGDAITFVMKRLGFSYPDAVVFLAEKFGINVEYVGEDNKFRKDVLSLHEDIQILLRKFLYSAEGKEAKEYILGRSFSETDLDDFGVGFSPPRADFDNIIKKYPSEILNRSGFFKEGRFGPQARFFSRLTLPIRNVTGSIAGFAGRSLDGSKPKYLNSSESDLFHKRGTLYNIDKAKEAVKKTGSCIVVEGYFDVMRLYSAGFRNVVAPMGTALTAEQINLIKRYAGDITVIFDGDEAGEKAAYRSLEKFIECGVFPKAVFLPEDDDPDSFVLKNGSEAFRKVFCERDDLFINVARRLAKYSENDFNKKLMRFQSVKKMLARTEDPHLRDYYSEAAGDIFGLKKENIEEDIARERYKISAGLGGKKTTASSGGYLCEKDFVACLAGLPVDVVDPLIEDMDPEMFNDEEIREILKKILEVSREITDIKEIAHELGAEFVELALRDMGEGDLYRKALENKRQIERNYLKKRHKRLIERQKNASTSEEKLGLIKELDELTRLIAAKNAHRGE